MWDAQSHRLQVIKLALKGAFGLTPSTPSSFVLTVLHMACNLRGLPALRSDAVQELGPRTPPSVGALTAQPQRTRSLYLLFATKMWQPTLHGGIEQAPSLNGKDNPSKQ